MQDAPNRRHVLAQLAFAGLIDVQDRMWHNRSYTTGHKATARARPSSPARPSAGRTRTTCSTPACRISRWARGGTPPTSSGATSARICWTAATRSLAQATPLTPAEESMLIDVITRQREFSVVDAWWRCSRPAERAPHPRRHPDRRGPGHSRDGRAEQLLDGQHGYEYCNTVGWFYDTFEHPHRLKLQPVAALFINRGSEHQPTRRATAAGPSPPDGTGGVVVPPDPREARAGACAPGGRIGGPDRRVSEGRLRPAPLVQTLATAACKVGNDRTIRSSASARWRTICTLGPTIATGSCWPAPSTRRGTGSTETTWRRIGASRRSWARRAPASPGSVLQGAFGLGHFLRGARQDPRDLELDGHTTSPGGLRSVAGG